MCMILTAIINFFARLLVPLLTLLAWVNYSYAAVDLELTQGISAALPIAVIPFANENQAIAAGNQSVTEIIKNDLQNSGEFRIKGSGLGSEDNAFWRKQGVNDVVTGSVSVLGGGKYQVSFQLASVFNQPNADLTSSSPVLINQTFTVNQVGLRRLAHHISDLIYEKLTGVRGIFSTQITYIVVQRNNSGLPAKYILEVADADGFNSRPLLASPQPLMSPTWAPNGRQIAYVSFENNKANIYLQDLASGSRRLQVQYPGNNGAPAFSPDGKKLALVLTLSGNPKIYTFDLSSNQLTQITQGYSIDTEPAWSLDGRALLFTSDAGGNPQIYRYDLASKQTERVTFDGDYNARASFLPDRKGIIMMHRKSGAFGIARQDFETGRVSILTQTGVDESPSLAPNGKMVIYATKYQGRGVLAVVSTDGRIKLRLPSRGGDVQEPAWSPFVG